MGYKKSFESWKRELDSIFADRYGFTSDDFEDYLWYREYASGKSAMTAFVTWRNKTMREYGL